MKRRSLSTLAIALAMPTSALVSTGGCSSTTSSSAPPERGEVRSSSAALTSGQAVVWKNVVNATASGSTLTKTGGQPQIEDAGGTSQQAIVAGTGTFSFTVTENTAFRFAGLTHAASQVGGAGIDFAFRIQSGTADIYENNTYVADETVANGDTLSVTVANGVVTYAKNGTTLLTSAHQATYPLIADASFIDPNAEVASAQISGATGYNADWSTVVNATATGSDLVKTGGQPQVEDSGGTTAEQIASGDGFLQFSISETSTFRFLGLGHSSSWVGAASLDYSFRIQGGYVAVYERDVYQTEAQAHVGDTLEIQATGGIVTYLQNGSPLYTSQIPVTYPLVPDASLIDANAEVDHVIVSQPAQAGGGADAGTDASQGGGGGATGGRFAGWLAGEGYAANADNDPNYQELYNTIAPQGYLDEVNPTWWFIPETNTTYHCCSDTSQPFCTSYANPSGPCPASQFWSKKGSAKVVPTFADDTTTVTQAQTMVANPATAVAFIAKAVSDNNYDGVNIDLEHLCDSFVPPQSGDKTCPSRTNLTTFMTQLAASLHAMTPPRTVTIAIDAIGADNVSTNEWDIAGLDPVVDGFYVMGYDEHYDSGQPTSPNPNGPVDSLGLAVNATNYFKTVLSPTDLKKVLWGLPNYGLYSQAQFSTPLSYAPLATMIASFPGYATACPYNGGQTDDFGLTCGRDPNGYNAGNPAGQQYGFFDDIDSLEQRVSNAATAGLGGVTYWTIGGEANAPTDHFSDYFSMVRHYFPKQ